MIIIPYVFLELNILFFYRRIFVTTSGSIFDIIAKIPGVFILLWMIGFSLVNLFGCGKHFAWGWGPLIEEYNCVHGLVELEALMMLFVIILPIPIVSAVERSTVRCFRSQSSLVLDLGTQYGDNAQGCCDCYPPARSFVSIQREL